jgi:general secretion pathway protein D
MTRFIWAEVLGGGGIVRFGGSSALLWAFLAGLGSCTNLPIVTEDAKAPDVFDRIRALDLLPRQPLPVDQNAQIGGNRGKPVLFTGVVVPAAEARGRQAGGADGADNTGATGRGNGYELNFENTPIAMVAKAVLGDILGFGYAVDPRVQGTISLRRAGRCRNPICCSCSKASCA